MADLSTIQKAFETKQSFDVDSPYRGATRVGFVGDRATLGGREFSSPESLFSAISGGSSKSTAPSSAATRSGVNTGSGSFEDTVQRAIEMQRKAAEPAIESLRGSIPEVQQAFQQTRQQVQSQTEPLKARYENLLSEIRGQGQEQVERQTKITSGELGKRGLVGSSTLAQQELESAKRPIEQTTQRLATEAELAREEGLQDIQNRLAGLTTDETSQLRAIQNAIAQLQSGAGQAGIQTGSNIYQTNVKQDLARQEQERLARQQAIENALQQRLFEEVTLPKAQYDINAPYYKPDSGDDFTAQDFLSNIFGGVQQTYQPESTGYSNVDELISQGRFDEARQLILNP